MSGGEHGGHQGPPCPDAEPPAHAGTAGGSGSSREFPMGSPRSHPRAGGGPGQAPGGSLPAGPCVLTQIAPSTPRGSEGPCLERERRLNPRIP